MMDCTTARDLMLEAEPAELEGRGTSELVVHLAACTRCRAAARVILDGEGKLVRALAGVMPHRNSQEAVHAAARRRTSHRRWMQRSVSLAAAAVVAIMLLGRRTPVTQPASFPTQPSVG